MTTRPHATAWATPDEICVSVPTSNSRPYVARYPRTVSGLAAALNILIEHSSPAPFHAEPHPIINAKVVKPPQPKVGTPESRANAADIVRRMFK